MIILIITIIINKTPALTKKDNPECVCGGRNREMKASVARRGNVRMRGVPVCSDEPENMTFVKNPFNSDLL